jgi:UDP-N-acetylglucosamine--N-acetylmuramyl-(pentapeptide) pyrophosphoryl-undecaprenol N-acetylglucosamine transferase
VILPMGRLAIACGGTGGHLFPGLAIAEAVRRRGHDVRFFISAKPVDRRALAGAGESAHGVEIPAVGWTGLFGALAFAVRLVRAVRKAGEELVNFKADALLGMGGFVSAASVGAARRRGLPYFLHESNAIPGRATKFLSRGARKTFVGFAECGQRLPRAKVELMGTPVRSRLGKISREEALKKLGLHPKRHLVAVLGGSQGAKGINEAMVRGLPALKSQAATIQILHLAGEAHADKVRHAYEHSGFHAIVLGFCDEMDAVYAAADLVVSRAGAGTLAELAACGVPAILIPFPAAVDDHQTANAHAYADQGAAEIVAEKNLAGTELGQRVARLLGDSIRQDHMRRAARNHFHAEAAEKIAEEIAHVL